MNSIDRAIKAFEALLADHAAASEAFHDREAQLRGVDVEDNPVRREAKAALRLLKCRVVFLTRFMDAVRPFAGEARKLSRMKLPRGSIAAAFFSRREWSRLHRAFSKVLR